MVRHLDWILIGAGGITIVLTNVWVLSNGSIPQDWVVPHTILNILGAVAMAAAYFFKGE